MIAKVKPGDVIDQLFCMREERLGLEREVESMKKDEKELKSLLLIILPGAALDGAMGKLATVSIQKSVVPVIATAEGDWPALYAYIHKHKAYEMLQKRLSPEPFRERWAAKEAIPGVRPFVVEKLSLTKR